VTIAGTPKRVAKCLDVIRKGEDDEAVNYFVDLLPRLAAKHPEVQMTMCLQRPGETMFVPGGWWHAVLNLEDSIAVTQVRIEREWHSCWCFVLIKTLLVRRGWKRI
jgi:hypothetical protein